MADKNLVQIARLSFDTDPLLRSEPPVCAACLWRQEEIARVLIPLTRGEPTVEELNRLSRRGVIGENLISSAKTRRAAWDALREIVEHLEETGEQISPRLRDWRADRSTERIERPLVLSPKGRWHRLGAPKEFLRPRNVVRAVNALVEAGELKTGNQTSGEDRACRVLAYAYGFTYDEMAQQLSRYKKCDPETKKIFDVLYNLERYTSCHRHLDHLDEDGMMIEAVALHPSLTIEQRIPYTRVPSAVATVRKSAAAPTPQLAFEFLALTAERTEKVRLAKWGEIDRDKATCVARQSG